MYSRQSNHQSLNDGLVGHLLRHQSFVQRVRLVVRVPLFVQHQRLVEPASMDVDKWFARFSCEMKPGVLDLVYIVLQCVVPVRYINERVNQQAQIGSYIRPYFGGWVEDG